MGAPKYKTGDIVSFKYDGKILHATISRVIIEPSGLIVYQGKYEDWYYIIYERTIIGIHTPYLDKCESVPPQKVR